MRRLRLLFLRPGEGEAQRGAIASLAPRVRFLFGEAPKAYARARRRCRRDHEEVGPCFIKVMPSQAMAASNTMLT